MNTDKIVKLTMVTCPNCGVLLMGQYIDVPVPAEMCCPTCEQVFNFDDANGQLETWTEKELWGEYTDNQ